MCEKMPIYKDFSGLTRMALLYLEERLVHYANVLLNVLRRWAQNFNITSLCHLTICLKATLLQATVPGLAPKDVGEEKHNIMTTYQQVNFVAIPKEVNLLATVTKRIHTSRPSVLVS